MLSRAQLRLQVLEDVLQHNRVVALERLFQSAFADLGEMAGCLDADLLHRSLLARRRLWYVGEFDADLYAVNPIARKDDDARVFSGAGAGSLVEQGGEIYQQASYQDGQAHVYASNIPTLGGIVAGTTAEKRSEVARIAAAARWGKRDK